MHVFVDNKTQTTTNQGHLESLRCQVHCNKNQLLSNGYVQRACKLLTQQTIFSYHTHMFIVNKYELIINSRSSRARGVN